MEHSVRIFLKTFSLSKIRRYFADYVMPIIVFPIAYISVFLFSLIKGKRYFFVEINMKNFGGWGVRLGVFLRAHPKISNNTKYMVVPSPRFDICNTYLYELTKRHLCVVENPILKSFLLPLARIKNPLNISQKFSHTSYFGDAPDEDQYPPFEWFTEQDHRQGKALLEEMGFFGNNAWYVCFYARDDAYNEATSSGELLNYYKTYHSCRNSDINRQIKAMKYVIERGGFVIRMGRVAKDPVNFSHPRLIDYPFSKFKSDFADVYLSCHCKFIIGDASGLVDLSAMVDMPNGWINGIPMIPQRHRNNLIMTPKLMRRGLKGPYLTLNEYKQIFGDCELSIAEMVEKMNCLGIIYEDNSEEDIYLLTVEMYRIYVLGECLSSRFTDIRKYERTGCGAIWPEFLDRHSEILN